MELNKEQIQAVEHEYGPLLIIAGAGTGKTRVISERFLFLLKKFHLQTDNILCLTYTEKGAAEMENRIEERLKNSHNPLWIHTFHGFAERILRIYGHEIGLSKKHTLLTGAERFIFIRDNLSKFNLDYYKPIANPTSAIHDLLNFFDNCKTENISVEKYTETLKEKEKELNKKRYELLEEEKKAEEENILKQKEALSAFGIYNKLLREQNMWDYGDMIFYLLTILKSRPSVLQEIHKQFKFILVDEYQDTNTTQNEIVRLLGGKEANITVVGDDDQSIFRFQGASVKNILEFTHHYPESKEIVLTENYRSSQNILNAAYSFITKNNPYRLEIKQNIQKKLTTNHPEWKDSPVIFETKNTQDEVSSIIEEIESLINTKKYEYKDIAILYRNHSHSEAIIEGLKHKNIPFHVVEGSGLFRRQEIRELFACIRAITNPEDDISLFRMLSLPFFEIDPFILLHISNYAQKNNLHIIEVLKEHKDIIRSKNPEGPLFAIHNPDEEKIQNFLTFFHDISSKQFSLSTIQILELLLSKTGWLENLNKEESPEDIQKRANILKIIQKAKQFEYEHEHITLNHFIRYIDALIEGGENPEQANFQEDGNNITLMTIHKSKGLEWNVVFIIQLAARKFPTDNKKAPIPVLPELLGEEMPDKDMHISEERRLLYVAMTRAKEKLFLTYAKNYGTKTDTKSSRFLKEIEDIKITEKTPSFTLPIKKSTTEKPEMKVEKDFSLPILNRSFNLNYSGITAFKDCPLKFKYLNIIQIPRPEKAAPLFGRIIHDTLDNFYTLYKNGSTVTEETLLSYYKKNWKSYGYINKEQEEQYYNKGFEILSTYWNVNKDTLKKPLFLERGFKLKIGKHNVSGYIDRIDRIHEDEVEVIDYKTGTPKTLEQLKKDKMSLLQLYIYAIACQDLFNLNAMKLTLYYLDNNTKVSVPVTPEDLSWTQEIIEETGENILQSNFHGTPSQFICSRCDYEPICPSRYKD